MLQTKQLLYSSCSIKTLEQLRAKKREFLRFVGENFQDLRHSDMIRLLIGQYFMMHEYAEYHVDDTPPAGIKKRYDHAYCPVSMEATISRARKMRRDQQTEFLIVVPMET